MPGTRVPSTHNVLLEGNRFNRDLIVMTVPLYLMATFYNGPRALLLGLVALLTAKLTDRLAAMLRNRRFDKLENSSTTIALVLTLMLPVTVDIYIVVITVMLTLFVAKEAFGGFMRYPFNPAAVGFCIAAVCWPGQVLRYPQPTKWMLRGVTGFEQLLNLWSFDGVALLEGPSATLRNGGLPKIDFWSLLLGDYPGPMGVTCSIVIISCAVFLFVKKRLPLWTPLFFLGTAALIAFFLPRYTELSFRTFPQDFWQRLQVVKFEVLSGAMVYTAVFLVDEPSTLPRHTLSRIVYGILLGAAVMMFRYFGNYELGSCFAIVLVNAFSGYFDRAIGQAMEKRAEKRAAREEVATT